MLTITRQAAGSIMQLLASHEEGGRVLRIVERPVGTGRALMLALSRSRADDLVVSDRGLRIFLELGIAERLEGKRLHARREGDRTRFLIEQAP